MTPFPTTTNPQGIIGSSSLRHQLSKNCIIFYTKLVIFKIHCKISSTKMKMVTLWIFIQYRRRTYIHIQEHWCREGSICCNVKRNPSTSLMHNCPLTIAHLHINLFTSGQVKRYVWLILSVGALMTMVGNLCSVWTTYFRYDIIVKMEVSMNTPVKLP